VLEDRIGIHLGEVIVQEHGAGPKPRDLQGIAVDTCARVMGLARGGQILVTRAVFDSARQMLKGEDLEGLVTLAWASHGRYLLKGVEEPVEICEVSETGHSPPRPPDTTEKARRHTSPEEEPVLGWRPGVGQTVGRTEWLLEEKLGEGGFGEVWLGRHRRLNERRVFKFCFRADRIRSLKRELTLFRLLKERMGEHPNIVRLHEVFFEEPPYFLEEDYVEGRDLAQWCESQGGVAQVPLEVKLEIVAQVADALQAAHQCGVIHRDVKPGNILVARAKSAIRDPSGLRPAAVPGSAIAKLTDFGIGQVVSAEHLAGITRAGFTQTLIATASSRTGTQLYLAPELLVGEPATTRSDLYALGVVLYQLLVGAFPRPLTSDWTRDIADPLLRDDLWRCVAGRPEERFAGAGQLAENLRHYPERKAEHARRKAQETALQKTAYRCGLRTRAPVAPWERPCATNNRLSQRCSVRTVSRY
jgi:serine/threonine-protein kinase